MSTFTIYPAIDIRGGRAVRLVQGDYNQETVYNDSPVNAARGVGGAGRVLVSTSLTSMEREPATRPCGADRRYWPSP